MNLLRTWQAPLMVLVLFWTLVVAPFAMARCAHDSGGSHLHALGSHCVSHAATAGEICCDRDADSHHAHSMQAADCSAYKADDTSPSRAEEPPSPPSPADFPPPYPALCELAAMPAAKADFIGGRSASPTPPGETRGSGTLPLLI